MWNCYSWQLNATTGGVDLPLDLPICALTVEMWNCHSWPLDATTGGVDLPPCLPKLPVSASVKWQIFYHLVIRVERWNYHSDALADPPDGRSATFGVVVFQGSMVNWVGVDLPLDLPIWAYQLIQCSGVQGINGQLGGRSATWSANMSSNSRNVKLPFLTTRCHYWVVDLPVDLPLDLPICILDH